MEEKKESPRANEQIPPENFELLTNALKNLSDRSPDKRKQGIADVEKLTRAFYEGRQDLEKPVLTFIRSRVIESPVSRFKKGGLLAFGSMCSSVIDHGKEGIHTIIAATTKAMNDDDSKVRFAACETMYNILNSCRIKLIDEICFILDSIIGVTSAPDNPTIAGH
ncbi:MAG: hypothetical protein P4M11_13250 [Candidatus Pacebacteria bacterium]|nr:hypothetical protein [Candidatus Paceibacterota bacterium]